MLKNSQVSKKHCGQKRIKWSALKKHLKHLKDMNKKNDFLEINSYSHLGHKS